MTLRLIHTSDWQIGKVFRFVDDATGPIASKSWSRISQSAAARAAVSILTIWNGGRPVGWRGRHAPAAFVEGEI